MTSTARFPGNDSARRAGLFGLLAAIGICWMLITPPGAAPDEPSHLTRAGAIVHGQLDGEYLPDFALTGYDLPDSYLLADPSCYAFDPTTGTGCATSPQRSGATIQLASRSDEYPLWGHLTFGVGSRAPGLDPIWGARAVGVAVAVGLVGASLRLARRPLAAAGVVVAMTPMAWGTVSTVNPSAFGIAGGVALWTALLSPAAHRPRVVAWLTAAGWVALALPRRDGLIWACLIAAISLTATDRSVPAWWRSLGLGPQLLISASTVATIVWGLTNDRRVTQLVALSPLILVGAEVCRRIWLRFGATRLDRINLALAGTLVGVAGLAVLLRTRPGGWDGELARAVVDQTGNHLTEAIGVLGWLDTMLPGIAVLAVVVAVGTLAAASLSDHPAPIVLAGMILGVAVVTSWVFELYQGNVSGRYWQGRYSLPLLAGVPIALTATTAGAIAPPIGRRVAWVAGTTMLVVLNVAAWSAARRWGVGIDGSLLPWRWDTAHTPVEPVVVLIAHAVATTGLAVVLFARSAPDHGAVVVDGVRRRTGTAR